MISASDSSALPWTWISTIRSGCCAPASRPATRTSNANTSANAWNADLRRDVGAAVVVVIERVMHVDGSDREEHADVHLETARQPYVWKRLKHRHRCFDVGNPREPLPRKEVPSEIVERVLQDLVRGRLYPERHL